METVNERSSLPPQAQLLGDDGQGLFVQPHPTIRCGVEPREVVLQQFRESSDVIMLDSDDELDHHPHTATTQKCNTVHTSTPPSTSAQVIQSRIDPSSPVTPASANASDEYHKNASKRRLFNSTSAKKNMYKTSGLPSPPRSEESSPQSSFGPGTDDLGHGSWSYGNPSTHQNEHKSQSWGLDSSDAGKLSVRLTQLVNPRLPAKSTSGSSSAQASVPEAASNAKTTIEAQGIARSQQLRAKRKAQDMDEQSHLGASRPPIDTAYKLRYTREEYSQDIEELSPDEIESQLDFAQMLRTEEEPPIKTTSTPSGRRVDTAHGSRLHPYSRVAAETFRTQGRHLDSTSGDAVIAKTILADDTPDSVSVEEQRRREERLIRMKVTASGGGRWDPTPKAKKVQPSRPPAKFYPPFDDKSTSKQKGPSQKPCQQSRDSIRKLMGTSNQSSPSTEGAFQSFISAEQPGNNAPQRHPPNLAVLEKLNLSAAPQSSSQGQSHESVQDFYDSLPPQGDDWSPPKQYEHMEEKTRRLVRKRDLLRERHRDLKLISSIYTAAAKVGALGPFTPSALKGLKECKCFTEAVLVRECSGRRARQRIMKYLKSLVRRLRESTEKPDMNRAGKMLEDIMLPAYSEKLETELPEIEARLTIVEAECKIALNEFKSQLQKDKGKGAGTSKGLSKALNSEPEATPSTLKKTQQQQIAAIQAQLAQFPTQSSSAGGITDSSDELKITNTRDDESMISEEDVFDNTMGSRSAVDKLLRSDQQDSAIEETNRLENERQHQEAGRKVAVRPAQMPDMSLLERMAARSQQKDHAETQGVQRYDSQMLQDMHKRKAACAAQLNEAEETPPFANAEEQDLRLFEQDETEVESSHEFNDSDLDEEDEQDEAEEEDEEGQPVCKRYIVKASIAGISPRYDKDDHLIGKFLNRKKAMNNVLKTAPWVKREHHLRNPDSDTSPCSITLKDAQGEYEQQMILGQNEDAGCRTWIEEEMYNPSEEAYEKAKVYKACQPQAAWFVDWTRTIKPCQEGSDEDDLFGPDSEPYTIPSSSLTRIPVPTKSATEKTVVTRANGDQFRVFSNLAMANRHAKDVFMRWFIDQQSGAHNFRYVAGEDNAIEDELKRIGDRAAWSREDAFDTAGDDGIMRNDCFRVWVRKARSSGPSN